MATNLSNQINNMRSSAAPPIWQKGYLTMKNYRPFHYRVDFVEEKIEISKSFAAAAQKAKSPAHKQLMDIRKAYPGFGVAIYTTQISKNKQTYDKLTYDEMRRCIIEWDSEESANLATLSKAVAEKVPYPKVKHWYLGIYGEHYKRAADVAMPVMEETAAVGISDTAADNC